MMAKTFQQLIDANKRNSILLSGLMFVLIVVVAFAVSMVWGGGDWRFGLLPAGIAAVVVFCLILFSFYGGGETIMALSKAGPLQKGDDPQLYNVVEEMTLAAGLPTPKVYLINDPAPNAFATGRDPAHAMVAITTGLRAKLTRPELQGVIAHEISHVRNFDIRFAMLMAVLVGFLVLLSDIFLRSMIFGGVGGRRSRRSGGGGGQGMAILMIVALILSIVAPILAKLIQLAHSRQREYLADASAIDLTRNPDGLAGALAKLARDPNKLAVANRATQHLYIVNPLKPFESRKQNNLFSTHPPIEDRISRILSLKKA